MHCHRNRGIGIWNRYVTSGSCRYVSKRKNAKSEFIVGLVLNAISLRPVQKFTWIHMLFSEPITLSAIGLRVAQLYFPMRRRPECLGNRERHEG